MKSLIVHGAVNLKTRSLSWFVPIHLPILGIMQFPIHKCEIFCKVKKIKELRGGVHGYAAQEILKIDAEIAENGHLWMETG
jgi:hypothetical protein